VLIEPGEVEIAFDKLDGSDDAHEIELHVIEHGAGLDS